MRTPARLHRLGADLLRRAVEAFAAGVYKSGFISKRELRLMLGYETGQPLDGFLKEHGIEYGFTLDEIEQQVRELRRLGV